MHFVLFFGTIVYLNKELASIRIRNICTLCQDHKIFHDYRILKIFSTLCMLRSQSSEKRTITQFHYTAWPDHGTPEEIGLGQFHKAVTTRYQPGGLMLVHCRSEPTLICTNIYFKMVLCYLKVRKIVCKIIISRNINNLLKPINVLFFFSA